MYEEVILPQLIAVGVALLATLSSGIAIGWLLFARRSYYRGLYDGLPPGWSQSTSADVKKCLLAVRGAVDRGWYGQSSDGWRWPLPSRAELDPLGESGGTVDRVSRG